MPHSHPHTSDDQNARKLLASAAFNLLITLAEVIGGLLSGSLALLSDALHNFSDTTSLLISLGALRLSQRLPDRRKTFGYRRAQILGALLNLLSLIAIAVFLVIEAVERYYQPQPVRGDIMLVVALIGLAANLITAALLHRPSQNSLNIRSAFIHILGDAFSSIGVVLGGVLIYAYGWNFVDALLTLGISIFILVHSVVMLRQTLNILMQAVPEGLDLDQIVADVRKIDDVVDLHHVHVWQLDEAHANLEAHLVVRSQNPEEATQIKQIVKQRLASAYNISHTTLEIEFTPCQSAAESCYECE
ncbi:MAG: cation diffusion facilitator family transporter [Chloroflexi bacterium]|nr:cation diffusion facilitator family transporter [Chloroflexota bacterium]